MAESFTLIYFPARGRGEFIRYIFAEADIPYTDRVIRFDEWKEEKQHMPFEMVPVLEVNGKKLCQSTSIGRYLAEKFGLAGNDEWSKATADMLVQCIEDIYGNYKAYFKAGFINDEEAKAKALKVLLEETLKPLLGQYENFLGNNKYFVGQKLTWADLAIAELCDRCEKCFDENMVESYPHLKQHMIRIHELPNIKKYVEQRPSYPL